MTVFRAGGSAPANFEVIPLAEVDCARFSPGLRRRHRGMELAVGASAWDHRNSYGRPAHAGILRSGVNNFGVMEVLNAVVDISPRPARASPSPR